MVKDVFKPYVAFPSVITVNGGSQTGQARCLHCYELVFKHMLTHRGEKYLRDAQQSKRSAVACLLTRLGCW